MPDDVDYAELFSALCAEYSDVTGVNVPTSLAPRASRSTPPTSSSLAEETTPPLAPPPLGRARYRRSEPDLAPRASRSTPPTSSSLAEETTPPLAPPPLGGARYRRSEPGGRRFGSDAIRINNKIFAMLVKGRLVVKLPRARVTELIETGHGQPFDSGKGTPMKEWVVLTGDEAECRALVVQAQAFVG